MSTDIKRPLLKTITYRLLGSSFSMMIAYFTSGSVKVGAMVGLADMIIKPMLYFTHEIIWDKVKKP